ncbi:MAG: Tol-Pal system protein TolB [Azospira oryzae]|uniref:Tol-Pal system protein TolB n=1 Tax=Pelomicrobium methylotrophicum TaxID=2602750 RepID=A0A5C7EFB7_9PROT|nr:Tol-Pal system beta propeller repeat protein TolB [Pelomicrobium methylotrophicum]PZP60074.1 MAG: Tol-Pal system protein TolB [Azospira oryzae]PZP80510.1 MAG: Tol-Pal system protein TolB [Azospira oryzae]TXF10900.1 Tol-Pal system protein TolB [Pelomicrobium methylotrophicum]
MNAVVRSVPFLRRLVLLALLLAASSAARANLTIEIIGGGATQIPIAVVPFARESVLPQSVTEVVGADLARSGLFRLVPVGSNRPSEPNEVLYPEWQSRGAEALVIGAVVPLQDGRFEIRFRLMDVLKQQQLAGFTYTVTADQLRLTAHRIADVIYERLTGDKGVFSTRIAYVVRQGNRYELQVADADGFNPQTVVASNEPIISPAWSPDGTRLAYVSFENRKPIIYVQNLLTGQRRVLANYKGSNSAPAWSPDGKRLAVVLTKDGISQIYLVNADGTGLTRLTHSGAIDTEPSFSPDGEWLLFTSDRGGSPQIYRIAVNGGSTARLTFEGDYNVSPHYSPDGKSFVFVTRRNGRFNVAVQDMVTGQVQVLTDSRLDESPTFAPNGRMILYATEVGGRGVLAAVSSDGRVRQRLTVRAGDVREPAWGPFVQ